jgi:hypothetical protein
MYVINYLENLKKLIKLKKHYDAKQASVQFPEDEFSVSVPYRQYERLLALSIEALKAKLPVSDEKGLPFPEWFSSLSKEDQDEVIKPLPSSSFFDNFDVDENKEFKLKRD